jgi:hypothetical protein
MALPPLFWVLEASRRASYETLGRDQGIFQYVAWALTQGEVDYRDVRDVNGPLTHFIHLAFLRLGGADEHRFRVLDLALSGAVFAFVGACLPGLSDPARAPQSPNAVERASWAMAGWVVLSGQYLQYGFWDLAQRESFFDWFLLSSVALQLASQAPYGQRASPARHAWLFALVGALSVIPWFGKPTYLLFTLLQGLGLVIDRRQPLARKTALAAFAGGGLLAAAGMIGLVWRSGDLGRLWHIQTADVPAMYRFIWPRSAGDLFSLPRIASPATLALVGAVGIVSLIATGQAPVRALPVALLPVVGLAGVLAQAKGFPYHMHPVTAGIGLQWLLVGVWLNERAQTAFGSPALLRLVRLVPVATSLAIGFHVATALQESAHLRAGSEWLAWRYSPPLRKTRAYFDHFALPDFFPYEMRQAADYLRASTDRDDRVQIYGMDPYVLFLAERLSATPYIYAYDLNADAALAGGTGARPNEDQAARIVAMAGEHENDLFARLQARPPAAFVFFDGAPLLTEHDAWRDFASHCPAPARWVAARYRETARFGGDRVWLRLDLASRKETEASSSEAK